MKSTTVHGWRISLAGAVYIMTRCLGRISSRLCTHSIVLTIVRAELVRDFHSCRLWSMENFISNINRLECA